MTCVLLVVFATVFWWASLLAMVDILNQLFEE